METKRILDSLNKEQQSAVKETEGYIRVVAGAGSGKTRVLTHRYVYIAKALGVPTEHILSATFTNKAANVMKKRIRDFIPDEVGGYIGTFHSICRKILSFDIHKLNYPKNFKILDVEDQKELLREIYEKNGLKLKNNIFSNVLTRIEVYKSDLKYIPELTSTESVKTFSNLNIENKTSTDFIINEYLKEQRKNFYLDFADLMYFTLYLLKTDKEFNDKWSNHFEYIQVDEFQDVSAEQYELVSLLSKNNGNLFIVGDPDQTIYSFRGADVNFFLDFDKEFKDVKTIILDTNYRSTPQILSASNSLITKNAKRIDKQLKPVKSGGLSVEYHHAKTRKDECEYIAKEIADIVEKGGCLNDCAVLYRNNNNSRAIEEALIRNKLSYVIFSGFAFYKRKEIKDVIAYLQMAETADDVSFLRTVNIPARGIGKTRLAYLREEAESYGTSLYTALFNNRFNSMFVGTGANGYIELVESMFHLVDEGHTYKETVDILNAEGYRRRNGKPLSYNITDLLRNRQYIGEYIFNLYKRSPCREKWRRQRKPESEVVRIVGGMPQIVETEVFERVQAKLDSRMQKNGRGRKKGKYLLTGLITCGICGSAVAGGKTVSRNKAYFSYICGGKPKHIGRKSINIVYLDKYIINLLTQAFLLQRNSDKVIELLRRCITTLHDKQTEKLTTLKKQLAEKESLISSLDDIILKNKGKTLASVISNNITEEKNEADKISLTIDKLKAERNSLPRINKETLRKKTLDFKKVLDGIDFYLKQELLQTLIKEIKIHADTVETIINLHELAGLKIPLTCTVFESIDNIRHPFTLRNIEFDFNRLQIQL